MNEAVHDCTKVEGDDLVQAAVLIREAKAEFLEAVRLRQQAHADARSAELRVFEASARLQKARCTLLDAAGDTRDEPIGW